MDENVLIKLLLSGLNMRKNRKYGLLQVEKRSAASLFFLKYIRIFYYTSLLTVPYFGNTMTKTVKIVTKEPTLCLEVIQIMRELL